MHTDGENALERLDSLLFVEVNSQGFKRALIMRLSCPRNSQTRIAVFCGACNCIMGCAVKGTFLRNCEHVILFFF